jgi:hypothetical protein
MLVVWFVASFLFFTSYNVGSPKFVPFQLVPTLLLGALAVGTLSERHLRLLTVPLVAAPLLLGAVNFTGSLYPASLPRNNQDLQRSLFVEQHTRPGDLVVHFGMGHNVKQKVYLPYFAWREELILDFAFGPERPEPTETLLDRIRLRIEQRLAQGRGVYLFSEILDDEALSARFHARNALIEGLLTRFFIGYRPGLHAVFSEDFKLYALRPRQVPQGEATGGP